MTAALALLAANLALGVAGKVVDGIANALDPGKAKAKKQADDFESMFLEQMTQHMFTNMGSEGPLGDNGTGGDVWRSQLTQAYAKQVQKSGGIGVSDQILREMLSLQARNPAGA